MEMSVCRHCGYRWEPRIAAPVACPSCKRYHWRAAAKPEEPAEKVEPDKVVPAPE